MPKNPKKSLSKEGLLFHFKPSLLTPKLVSWYQQNKAPLPWRLLWNKYQSPYHVWVSEIMLQQTTITAVTPVYHRFTKRFPNIESLAKSTDEEVAQMVRGLGYYRRFRLLLKGAKTVTNEYKKGKKILWPNTKKDWMNIPGVGDYTASAISSICFNEPNPVLDGNVKRVMCRLFNISKPVNDISLKKELPPLLNKLICHKNPGDFNQGIMELGQTVCTPSSPNCPLCPIKRYCLSFKKDNQENVPLAAIKKEKSSTKLELNIIKHKNIFGIKTRSAKDKFLKQSRGFLSTSDTKGVHSAKVKLGQFKHNITHHDITVSVFLIESKIKPKNLEWYKQQDLEPNLIANLDRKAWKIYLKSQS